MASPSKATLLSDMTVSHNTAVVRDRLFRLAGCERNAHGQMVRVDTGYDHWVAMSDNPKLHESDPKLVLLSHLISAPFKVTWDSMKELKLYGHGIKYSNWVPRFGQCMEEGGSMGSVLPCTFEPKHAVSKSGPSGRDKSSERSKMWWVNLAQGHKDDSPDNTAHHRLGVRQAHHWIVRVVRSIGKLELNPILPKGAWWPASARMHPDAPRHAHSGPLHL